MTTVATERWVAPEFRWNARPCFVRVRAAFEFKGQRFVALEVITNKIEVYDHYENGMERFVGYVGNPALPAALAVAAVEALCSRPTR